MQEVKTYENQNMVDLALQEYGSVSAIIDLARDNEISIDADIEAGETYAIDETKIVDLRMVKFLKSNNKPIVTGQYVQVADANFDGYFDGTFDLTFE